MSINTTMSDRPLAVVTGASSGIGRSLVTQFASHGFDVIAAAEDVAIEGVAAAGAGETTVRPLRVDLSTAEGVESLHAATKQDGRPVAAAALNAGVGVGGRFAETSLEADLELVDLNVRSTVHLAKLLSRDMAAAGAGRMLFTASIAASAPGPYHATYAASKAFVHSFAEAIRVELADRGVTVTSLMPGPTDTEFFERAGMEDTAVATGHKDDPDTVARDGFEALMAGKPDVVAGSLSNRIQSDLATHLPDQVAGRMQARKTAPGSGG